MLRKLTSASFVIFCATLALAEQLAPRLVCRDPVFDFGTTNNTAVVSNAFLVQNGGSTDCVISRIRTGCGCTTAVVSTNVIAPGAEAQVLASFNLRGRKGLQRKWIVIEYNSAESNFLRLEMTGTAEADLEVMPRSLRFGNSGSESWVERFCDLSAPASLPFQITGLDNSAPDLFSARLVTNQPGRSYRLYVKPLKADGRQNEAIIRVKTDHPRYSCLSIPVSTAEREKLIIRPTALNLLASETDHFSPRVFTVSAPFGSAFRVLEARFPFEGAKTRLDLSDSAKQRVIVEHLPVSSELDGKEMEVLIDHEGRSSIRVPIRFLPGT